VPVWSLAFRLGLRAFPQRFRELHGRDLIELYSDFAASGRPRGPVATFLDLLRSGLGARIDDLRPVGAPQQPRLPKRRNRKVESLWQDIRYALRMLRKSPAFTVIAVLSLAVGIGANTAIFSIVDAALLRPLAVQNPHQLVVLGWRSPAGTEMPDISTWGWYLTDDNGDGLGSSYSQAAYESIRDRNQVFTGTFAFADLSQVNVNFEDQAELASGQVVTGNYYAALGLEPAIGRLIVADDDRVDAESVVVLSHGYWQRRFGARADIVGTSVRVNNTPFTVIGVAPADFRGTLQAGDNPEISVPLAQHPRVSTSSRDMNQPQFWWLHVMGRLPPDASMEYAGEHLNALFHQSVEGDLFPDGVPEQYTLPDIDLRPGFQGMTEQRGQIRLPLRILSGVVGLVLLIACLNVANLLMARSGARRREIAVRLSIGASRGRLVRQLLAESLVLSAIAGASGVMLAAWGKDALLGAMVPRDLYIEGVQTNAKVLAFGLLISAATGLVFGLVPALLALRSDVSPLLKGGPGEAAGRHGGMWGMRSLLVAQVAMSMLLLVSAALFVRTLVNLERQATGFDASGVALLRMDPGLNGYDGARQLALYEDLIRRFKGIPGVAAATVTAHSPVSGRVSFTTLKVVGYEPAEEELMGAYYNFVAPEFFETFRIPLQRGRVITADDREGAPMVAVINQQFADRFFPDDNPIGHRIGLGRNGAPGEYEIVGVVADVKYQQLHDRQYPVAHVAVAQGAADGLAPMTLALRTSGDPAEAIAAARAIVRQVDANIPLFDVRTLAAQQAETLELERLFARVSLIVGALALGLACIGLYGILSYSVMRRTREIGVRMALGARSADVVRMVMGELRSVVLGVLIGLAAAYGITRSLDSLLYGLSASDPTSYVAATAVLLLVATLAAYVPARRASNVDPMIALRFD